MKKVLNSTNGDRKRKTNNQFFAQNKYSLWITSMAVVNKNKWFLQISTRDEKWSKSDTWVIYHVLNTLHCAMRDKFCDYDNGIQSDAKWIKIMIFMVWNSYESAKRWNDMNVAKIKVPVFGYGDRGVNKLLIFLT